MDGGFESASVRGRQRLGFLQLHLLVTTQDGALSCLGTQNFRAAYFALKSLAKLVHLIISLWTV